MKTLRRFISYIRSHLEVLSIIFCILICSLCIITKRPHTQKIWSNPSMHFYMGNYGTTISGDYGKITDGPEITLPVGRYRLQWYIEGDGENTISFASSNLATIDPPVFTTSPDEYRGDVTFNVLEPAYNLCINVNFQSGTSITVHSLRLSSPFYSDGIFLVCIIMILSTLLFIIYRQKVTSTEQIKTLLLAFSVTLIVAYPYLSQNIPPGWDVNFHAARIMNLADALRSGQFVSRVGGFSYNGYGAATSVFYPDLFLIPSAFLILCGCTITFAYNLLLFFVTFFMVLAMVYAALNIGCSLDEARCASVFYVFANYHLYDLHMNSMLGELIAMVFLPLFLCSLLQILRTSSKRWYLLSLSAYCIFSSHMVTTLQCLFLAVVLTAFYWYELTDRYKLLSLFKAILITVLVSLNRIVTFIDFYNSGVQTSVVQFGMKNVAMEGSMLFDTAECMGPLMWSALFIGLFALLHETNTKQRYLFRSFILLGLFCIFLSTQYFPWSYVDHWTQGILNAIVQFPSRFLLIPMLLFSVIGAYGICRIFPSLNGQSYLFLLIIAILSGTPIISDFKKNVSPETGISFGEGASPYLSNIEYQYYGTDVSQTREHILAVSDGIEIVSFEKNGTSAEVSFHADKEGSLSLPLFGFIGYQAEINGQPIPWYRGINNRLTVDIEEGISGVLTVSYSGKRLWTICDIVSFITLAFIIFKHFSSNRKASCLEVK